MMEEGCHQDFSIEIHKSRITITIIFGTDHYCINGRSLCPGVMKVYHIHKYGDCGTYIDRVRRGARAPWGAMMGRNDQNGEMARNHFFLHSFLMK